MAFRWAYLVLLLLWDLWEVLLRMHWGCLCSRHMYTVCFVTWLLFVLSFGYCLFRHVVNRNCFRGWWFNSTMQPGIFFPGSTFIADSLVLLVPLCLYLCPHRKSQALIGLPVSGHTEVQHTLGPPAEMDCGYPPGSAVENSHIWSLSPEKNGLPAWKEKRKRRVNYRVYLQWTKIGCRWCEYTYNKQK